MKFTPIAYGVLIGYLVLVAAVGCSFYRRAPTARDYFLGSRAMSWLPVGISIIAADMSAISLLGTPGWSFANNLELTWVMFGTLLAAPVMMLVVVPFYASLELYTAYEFLERRFHLSLRLIASALFQFLRWVHVALAIYAPSIALSLVTGLPMWQCILLMGIVTTIYTAFGGMRAVIWNDVIQFAVICAGIAAVFFVAVRGIEGGWPAAWRIASESGRLRFLNLSIDPRETTSLWACLLGGMTLNLASLATDQALIQRLFSTRSRRDAVQSVAANAILGVPLMTVLALLGTILFVYYRQHPAEAETLPSADAVVPFFALYCLPGALAGMVIAAIFAASMAVMSAGINALSTATTMDFYQRLLRPGAMPEESARFGRRATVVWGLGATFLALFMDGLGELAIAYNRISSLVCGPILGVFLLGMLTTRVTTAGALIGAILGTLAVAICFWQTHASFFYYAPVGLMVTLTAGAINPRLSATRIVHVA